MFFFFSIFLSPIPLCNDDTLAVFPDRPLSPLLNTLAVETRDERPDCMSVRLHLI